MTSNTLTKKRKCINFLTAGKGLTQNEAKARFGVGNFRAMISNIRAEMEQYGNWECVTEKTSNGSTRYFLQDTHPGTRTYGYDKFGNRYMLDNG